jgi:hypothetical protein
VLTTYRQLDPHIAGIRRDIRDYQQRRLIPQVAARRTALDLAAEMAFHLDDWQRRVVQSRHRRKLCLVSRQGGKGVVGTLAAAEKMIGDPGSKIVILTPTEEQSKRLLSRIKEGYARLSGVPRVIVDTAKEFHLLNGSRAYAMPGSETSVRGIAGVHLLIVDEAAFVPDPLYATVRPFLATTNGEELDLSTPHGKRGFFYRAMMRAMDATPPPHMFYVRVTGPEIPRISPEFLANERAELGDFVYRQEYLCEFLDDETQVFASDLIAAAKSPEVKSRGLARLGG